MGSFDTEELTCWTKTHKSKNVAIGCPNSHATLRVPCKTGGFRLIPLRCKSKLCKYCAYCNQQSYLARVRSKILGEKAAGILWSGPFFHATFTFRAGRYVAVPISYDISKSCASFALQTARRPVTGRYCRYGEPQQQWPGIQLESWGLFTEVQPETRMAHEHGLLRVAALPGKFLPDTSVLGAFLYRQFNHSICDKLGMKRRPAYYSLGSLGYVKMQTVDDPIGIAAYISKGLADVDHTVILANAGTHSRRRWSTGKGVLPPVPKPDLEDGVIIQYRLSDYLTGLSENGIEPIQLSETQFWIPKLSS